MARAENLSPLFLVQSYHFGIPFGREKSFLFGQEKKLISRQLTMNYKTTLSVGKDGSLTIFYQEREAVFGARWEEPVPIETITLVDFKNKYPKGIRYSTWTYSTAYKVRI